ncbi:hypothetical protein GALMADRAFT_597594 [Galerina marginata CBS 339.88]|uniref:Uncharacterized protein n=1 Tax=Galerina marginata (strain CBS 339.88) TaxID=685588 RepID=A0A067T4T0_GALM3|nr:hypothetical protein GALMADRAFT_597594 [Galerina marginata CBS 339.88]
MSRNDGGRRGSTSRGVRGRGRLGQIQPAGRGALPTRSNSLIPRPGSRVVSDSIPRGVVSLSSSRARASILQSARQVGIHGGTFNTAGTQQFNITLNCKSLNHMLHLTEHQWEVDHQ